MTNLPLPEGVCVWSKERERGGGAERERECFCCATILGVNLLTLPLSDFVQCQI